MKIGRIKFMGLIFILLLSGCGKGGGINMSLLNNQIKSTLSKVSMANIKNKKIYFGHMSVGYNIISGIDNLINENAELRGIEIKETSSIKDISGPVLAHSRNGENGNPKSKVDAFKATIEKGLGDRVDIAFFKFCYVDITADSDVEDIFAYYKINMNELAAKYKKTRFVHVTAPLTVIVDLKSKFKDTIKKIIGKKTYFDIIREANIKRNKFNELLIKEYGSESVFDLAAFESTYPDASRRSFKKNTDTFYELIPGYTNDGGHLDKVGRDYLGANMLEFLSGQK